MRLSSTLRVLVPLVVAGTLTSPAVGQPAPRPFDAHDLVTMARLSDPQVSPDGASVAYVLRTTDLEADRGRTDLWLVATEGGDPRRLTTSPESDTSPRWSPDGESLYFLSSRSGSTQVWRLPMVGGEAVRVTDLPLDVGGFVLSPDGSRLAITLEVFPDCETLRCTVERLEAEEASEANGRLYDELFVRHWDTWKDGRRAQLFVVPAEPRAPSEEAEDASEPVVVTRGLDADVPSKPFGGMEEVAWTPDGEGLVFTARDAGREEAWSTDFDLFLASADGSSAPVKLTTENRAWDTQPAFSPDGGTLAYLAMERPGFEADRLRIVLREWSASGSAGSSTGEWGPPRVLTDDWDRSVGSMAWAPDGRTIYVTAGNVGNTALFAVDAKDGSVREVVTEGHVRSPQPFLPAGGGSGRERIVFGRDTFDAPVDLYSVAAEGGEPARLTEVNAERLAEIRFGGYEQFDFSGWNDETVYGYVVKPVGFDAEGDPDRTYPVAFLIHGGPQGSFDNDFHYRWNPQVYAGAGYAVVIVDFHGSTGYGQEFTDSISGDWGGKPLVDLQQGLAAALERYPFLDGDRVCALGASYGGYMINWIAGNWPDRFRCLVNHDGVFDLRSMYFSTEELWFPEWDLGGPYWEAEEQYAAHNPASFVASWRTPMLVVHGALDYRVPLGQGLGAFTALQRQGVPSEFLYFPEENHWVLSPANSLQWHETVLDWLERWLAE
jgi:dipeptidyl aminopeptidase/acylaminoacyl peptidase